MSWRTILVALGCFCVALSSAWAEKVSLITVAGGIGPASADYISRAIDTAFKQGSECLIIQLDTPGGLLDSTKEIVQKILAAPVPVVVYVAPAGAGAGSAGCFVTLAADIAAMAPGTNIGAAHPVELGKVGGGEQKDDTMKQKLESFYASYIEAIAAKRNRNVEWARSSVKESASITAEQALEKKVIEILAADMRDLLKQLDGRETNARKLRTLNAAVVEIPMSLRESVFQRVWRPEVLFLLMLIAMYGIFFELSTPGAILPGVAGAISLILMLYMASVLPINIAGFALIVLALALFIIDLFAPTHGVLTGGGIIAFFLGSLMLFEKSEPAFQLSLAFIIPATVLTAAFFVFVIGAGLRSQFMPVKVGRDTMIGRTARALTPIDANGGRIFIEGELWRAVSDEPIPEGTCVEITEINGLTLQVRAKS